MSEYGCLFLPILFRVSFFYLLNESLLLIVHYKSFTVCATMTSLSLLTARFLYAVV